MRAHKLRVAGGREAVRGAFGGAGEGCRAALAAGEDAAAPADAAGVRARSWPETGATAPIRWARRP